MKQFSRIGNADVKVHMNLASSDNNKSTLNFDGNTKLSGLNARTGQRVLSGVANVITKEVFEALEAHIESIKEDRSTLASVAVESLTLETPKPENKESIIEPELRKSYR